MTARLLTAVIGAPLLAALLAGCAHQTAEPEQHYLLPAAAEAGEPAKEWRIRLELAGYLDQAGLVLETGDNTLTSARRHRWAEPLEDQLRRALAHHLGETEVDGGRLQVTVTRFLGTADGDARVSGQWRYQAGDSADGADKSGRFDITRPLREDGYPELVTRLDAAWQATAQQIAAALR